MFSFGSSTNPTTTSAVPFTFGGSSTTTAPTGGASASPFTFGGATTSGQNKQKLCDQQPNSSSSSTCTETTTGSSSTSTETITGFSSSPSLIPTSSISLTPSISLSSYLLPIDTRRSLNDSSLQPVSPSIRSPLLPIDTNCSLTDPPSQPTSPSISLISSTSSSLSIDISRSSANPPS